LHKAELAMQGAAEVAGLLSNDENAALQFFQIHGDNDKLFKLMQSPRAPKWLHITGKVKL
jgi:hypothetical protein